MRLTWKSSPVTVVFIIIGAVFLGLGVTRHIQARGEQRYLVLALTRQVDGHSTNISQLLSEAGGRSISETEDAVYSELQRIPSTSLITRGMISVHESSNGVFKCIID